MLRRQMLRRFRKPLIVITPKSMLRHPEVLSSVGDITHGRFQSVIGDTGTVDAGKVERLILCMGKVYYDLADKRRSMGIEDTAIVRIEQLYPFPEKELAEILKQYTGVRQAVWCQEEPRNQGAWYSQKHHLLQVLGDSISLECVSRPAQASSASGSHKVHQAQQQYIVEAALGITPD